MIILPQKLSDMKDSSSVFFVDLYVIHTVSGDLHYAALDVDVPFYRPSTTTPVVYEAQPIQRGDFSQSVDDQVNSIDFQISNVSQAFSSAMYQSFDFRGTLVDILQIAYPGSLGEPIAFKHVFHGYIDVPGLDEKTGVFTATLMPVLPNMQSCRTFGLSCNAWFGDPDECGAEEITVTSTVGADSTQTVIYDSARTEAENYWKSGVVTIGFESKKVVSSTTGSITVEYPFFTTPVQGTSYSVTNGCDQSVPDCTRHNNLQNYSGFPAIPFELVVKT